MNEDILDRLEKLRQYCRDNHSLENQEQIEMMCKNDQTFKDAIGGINALRQMLKGLIK